MTSTDVIGPPFAKAGPDALRVLVIGLNFTPEVTGISPYTTALARGLAARGLVVRAITAHPHYPEWKIREGYGEWTATELIDAVPVKRLLHYVPRNPGGLNRLVSELTFGVRVFLARWDSPDVVVLVSPALFATAIAMVRAKLSPRRPKVCVWVQDIYSLGITETGMGNGAIARFITWVEKTTLKAAAGVVVIHERFGEHLIEKLGVAPERVSIVRNWTHLEASAPGDVAAIRAAHGWPENETVVLHAGNMGVKQGLENVVHAAMLADVQLRPVRFVLLGNGSQRDELKRLGSSTARLQFIDSLDDVGFQNALAAADILLVNEKRGVSEMAVPSKLTSYFNASRPVIGATDPHGLTASEIDAACAGRIVAAGDPQALLDAALAIRGDPELARELGANGLRYRTTVLGETAAIDRFARWLRSLAVRPSVR